MSCTAEQIAEKKRIAQERLKERQQVTATNGAPKLNNNNVAPATASTAQKSSVSSTTTLSTPATVNTSLHTSTAFYGGSTARKTAELQKYEAKLRTEPRYKNKNRISSQPYPTKDAKAVANNAKTDAQKIAPVFQKTVTCTCVMVSSSRFIVITEGFHDPLITLFKTIPTAKYGRNE